VLALTAGGHLPPVTWRVVKTELKMPESLAKSDDEDFESVFQEEFCRNFNELPLDQFMSNGGWPIEDSFECTVDSVARSSGRVVVDVSFDLDEGMSTGCADVQRSESAFGKIRVVLDLDRQEAYAEDDN